MTPQIRTITPEELPTYALAASTGFHEVVTDIEEEVRIRRSGIWPERTWGAFDGAAIHATLQSFPTTMSLPGGADVPTTAITAVTTTATHRRQGLASRLMAAELRAARDRGEVAAALVAAEYPIYGRFGFGPSAWQQNWTVNARDTRMVGADPAGSLEFIDHAAARELAPVLEQAAHLDRPASIAWWPRHFDFEFGILRPTGWGPYKKPFTVVARDPQGEPIGLLLYRVEEKWDNWQPDSTAVVDRMWADRPDAYRLLWQFLLSLDHVGTVIAEGRAVDEPLPFLLADGRRAQVSNRNEYFWARPLDLPAFCARRRTVLSDRFTVQLRDPAGLCDGRFRLECSPEGIECSPSTAEAEMTMTVTDFSSVVMGAVPARALAAAGRIDEHTAGAVDRWGAAQQWPVAPWCNRTF